MTKNKKKKTARTGTTGKQTNGKEESFSLSDAWLSMRTGLKVVAILSVFAGLWVGLQVGNALKSFWEGLLWGFLFGGSIWLVFFLALSFNRWVRRR